MKRAITMLLLCVFSIPAPALIRPVAIAGQNNQDRRTPRHISVLLKNGKRVGGRLQSLSSDSFQIVDSGGTSHTVRLDDVAEVKSNNLSTGAKVGIGIAAFLALVYCGLSERGFCRN